MAQETNEPTVQLQIQLSLPDSVAREAKESGLLEAASLEILLREELRRRRVDRLFDAADRLAVLAEPALTQEDVDREIPLATGARPSTLRRHRAVYQCGSVD